MADKKAKKERHPSYSSIPSTAPAASMSTRPSATTLGGAGDSTNELTQLVNKRLQLPMTVSSDRLSLQTTTTSLSGTNLEGADSEAGTATHPPAGGAGAEPPPKYFDKDVSLDDIEKDIPGKPPGGKFRPLIEEERESWDNKVQFILAIVGYAVGLGNVWRFPYLAQKNGGGAFLIPYTVMLLIEGIPIFYLELAVGQRLRKGAIGAWNQVHPYLGGIGIASAVVSFLVALYYNTIISWCLYYLVHSFQSPLPWSHCPQDMVNGTAVMNAECAASSPTQYFWYRETLNISSDIEHADSFNWHIMLVLLAAWLIVYLCMIKGIQSSGKVVYFTATFPYLVLVIFFFRGVTLKGFEEGLKHMFVPEWHRLLDPEVWLEAATQIFFSLGLAFGGLIAFSSYMPVNNNVFRDAIAVSVTNCGTSVFAGIVVFSILGFKAQRNYDTCVMEQSAGLLKVNTALFGGNNVTGAFTSVSHAITAAATAANGNNTSDLSDLLQGVPRECNIKDELQNAASGTGLAFIAFTEAIDQFPGAPFWAVIFFLMLLTLGLDSMFGTLEGVVTSIIDMNIFPNARKPVISGVICLVSFVLSLMFAHGAGNYVFTLFDDFSGNIPLLVIALFECIAISYIYGSDRFARDIELMTGSRPSLYWLVCWKYVSPIAMIVVLFTSVVQMFLKGTRYNVWDVLEGQEVKVEWPVWAQALAALLILASLAWIPLVWFVRHFNLMDFAVEEPAYFPEQELKDHYDLQPRAEDDIGVVERVVLGMSWRGKAGEYEQK